MPPRYDHRAYHPEPNDPDITVDTSPAAQGRADELQSARPVITPASVAVLAALELVSVRLHVNIQRLLRDHGQVFYWDGVRGLGPLPVTLSRPARLRATNDRLAALGPHYPRLVPAKARRGPVR